MRNVNPIGAVALFIFMNCGAAGWADYFYGPLFSDPVGATLGIVGTLCLFLMPHLLGD